MILFAIVANALMILSIYVPHTDPWYLYLLIHAAIYIIYFVFIFKSANTAPEKKFNLQRLVLIVSALIIIYLTFEPVVNRRKPISADANIYACAMICGTLLVRHSFYDHD